jgi:adenosylcobinamide-phosphate synthase
MNEPLIILVLAVVFDFIVGDPPNAVHPVAWMGRIIAVLEKTGLRLGKTGQFIFGIFMTVFTAGLFGTGAYYLVRLMASAYDPFQVWMLLLFPLVIGFLLKLTFSVNGLRRTANNIRKLLEMDDLDKTRHELRALVSRDTSKLSPSQISSAAIESVAEGLCDSVIAPLFYFLLLGLPGAFAYRAVNTLDSMIGYRGRYEHLGKFAARLDDVLNFIPARLAALVIIMAARFEGKSKEAWRIARRDRTLTASPNAGWPMAAMAGALDVTLEKPAHYTLGSGREPLPEHISQSAKIYGIAVGIWLIICGITGGIILVL